MMDQAIRLANTFGRWLFDQLWQMSLELAVLAVVIYAVIAILKPQSAALRHIFWGLLLAKPVVTFLIASPVSLYWFLSPGTGVIAPPDVVDHVVAPARIYPEREPLANVPRVVTRAPAQVRTPLDRHGLLALAWLCGCGALALRLVFGFAFVSFLRRTVTPVRGGPLRELLDHTSQELGVRPPIPLGLSSVSHGPVLAGVLRPAILLPQHLASELQAEQMRTIIAHELAHARRRDNLVLLVQRLAEMILFFHPVVWLGGKMMRREAEAACDDVVLKHFGDSQAYADCLTRVAEMRFGITQRLLVNTFAAAETNFSRRLRRILHGPARRMTVRLTLVSVGALVLIGCLGLPRLAHRDADGNGAIPGDLPESALLDFAPVFDPSTTEFGNGLAIVLGHVGERIDYTTLMGDLGLAFILQASETDAVIDGAPDAGWWPLSPECLPTLLSHLEPVVGRSIAVYAVDYEVFRQDPAAAYRQSLELPLKQSIATGRPVLANHGFWKLITGYDTEDPPLIGYCPSAQRPEPSERIPYPWMLVTVGEQTDRLSRAAADIRVLQLAVSLGGDAIEMPRGYRTGQQAFAVWAKSLRDTVHKGEPRWHANVIGHLHRYRTCASDYLESMAQRHSPEVATHLTAAAELYREEIAVLDDAERGDVLMTASGRLQLAQRVERMAEMEARAVGRMADALTELGIDLPAPAQPAGASAPSGSDQSEEEAKMTVETAGARVLRDGNRVWIDGVHGWSMSEEGSSIHAAQAAVMGALGEDITYTDLLGFSGLAFRLQVERGLCPSSPHSFVGKQCVAGSVAALPREIRIFEVKEDDAEGVREAREAVRASIDRGVPVQYGNEEDGLIVGYQKDGEEWICYHPMRNGGTETFVERKWPWGIAVFTQRKDLEPDRRELTLASFQLAVEMAASEDVEGYTLGKRAWDTWIGKLRELETANEAACAEVMMGNSWIYTTLVEYRTHAAKYLRAVAPLFEEVASDHLLAAAEQYEQMAGSTLIDQDHCALDAAPPPWHLQEDQEWTAAWRVDQIRRLEAARPMEERALREIELALASLE